MLVLWSLWDPGKSRSCAHFPTAGQLIAPFKKSTVLSNVDFGSFSTRQDALGAFDQSKGGFQARPQLVLTGGTLPSRKTTRVHNELSFAQKLALRATSYIVKVPDSKPQEKIRPKKIAVFPVPICDAAADKVFSINGVVYYGSAGRRIFST